MHTVRALALISRQFARLFHAFVFLTRNLRKVLSHLSLLELPT